MLNIYRKNIRK